MKFHFDRAAAMLLLALPFCVPQPAQAQVSVWTYHYDNARTGADTSETTLTPENVNPNMFGKLFQQPTDGQVYAQPLLVPNVAITNSGVHNVVYVCTMHDSVYAFDADAADGANAQPLWKTALAPGLNADGTGVTSVPAGDLGNGYGDIKTEVGIIGTPVIDTVSGTLYVVAKTKEVSGTSPNLTTAYVQRLHALDIRDGSEKFQGPAVISASVAGTGYNGAYGVQDAAGGRISFNARTENQRPGLLLLNGKVYIGWAAHEDKDPYHGWLIGYDAADLSQPPDVYCASPNGDRAGIWQGSMAPAADADGNIYVETGNGSVDPAQGNHGDAFVKLSTTGGLHAVDYFIPYNQATLDVNDTDLGCSGPMLLPDQPGAAPHLLIGTGKEGIGYILNRDSLGGYHTTDNVVQKVAIAATNNGPRGAPAYWNGSIYYVSYKDTMKAWPFSSGALGTHPSSAGPDTYGYLGSTPTISANGTSNGIAWAVEIGAYGSGGPAVLRAYDALDLSRELYASDQTGGRDTLGPAIKFTVPVVANGKVYVGAGDGLYVFGAVPDTTAPTLLFAASTQPGMVLATFNRPIETASGTDTSHYAIDHGVQVLSAALSADGRTATLLTSPLVPGVSYTLSTTGLLDTATPPHRIADNTSVTFAFVPLSGDGLLGHYFTNTQTLTGSPALTRVDPTINFSWGSSAPDPLVSANNFSVRWTGYVQPVVTGDYTFYANSDDGIRLWVNDQSLLPTASWSDHGATEYSGVITLAAGLRYPIRVEYYDHLGSATAQLSWSGPGVQKTIVPQAELYSRGPAFTMADAATALGIAGGIVNGGAQAARLDVETGPRAGAVDIEDAIRLLRKVMGVDPNP